jgi:hypothetical protein
MSPDAPEAEIFKEYAKKHEGKNGTTIPAAATGTYCLRLTIFSLQSSFAQLKWNCSLHAYGLFEQCRHANCYC